MPYPGCSGCTGGLTVADALHFHQLALDTLRSKFTRSGARPGMVTTTTTAEIGVTFARGKRAPRRLHDSTGMVKQRRSVRVSWRIVLIARGVARTRFFFEGADNPATEVADLRFGQRCFAALIKSRARAASISWREHSCHEKDSAASIEVISTMPSD